jgi:hypothetical protein
MKIAKAVVMMVEVSLWVLMWRTKMKEEWMKVVRMTGQWVQQHSSSWIETKRRLLQMALLRMQERKVQAQVQVQV